MAKAPMPMLPTASVWLQDALEPYMSKVRPGSSSS